MDNKIVVVTGIKGGTGKSTITSLLANYFRDKNIPVMVCDADIQGTVKFERSDDLKIYPEKEPSWDVHWIAVSDDFSRVVKSIQKVPGVVIVDCPGNVDDARLCQIYKAAYMAIVPFRYDRKNVKATFEFSRAFNQVSRAMMLYVPNMVSAFEGFRKSFRDAKAYAEENFKGYSDPCITPKIMDRIELRDSNTLFLTSKQRGEVRNAFEMIIKYLNLGDYEQ